MSETLSDEQVRHVGKLARIRLSDDEVAAFSRQLTDILTYVDQLGELNLDGVQPLAHALDVHNVLADDVPADSLSNELALREAPAKAEGFFLVPRVLGEDSGA
ncbi:MAG: Glutamyl-tRNA(Gln) amidotransferase subunit C [Phycisphaerae bacterium]|nr:Glutamyl-tRNA(Gln) amidotransferase subunit C [Phycisphaerae bacterium]